MRHLFWPFPRLPQVLAAVFQRALEFIHKHLRQGQVVEGLPRNDTFTVPATAMREALARFSGVIQHMFAEIRESPQTGIRLRSLNRQFTRIGNSLGIIIDKAILDLLNIK